MKVSVHVPGYGSGTGSESKSTTGFTVGAGVEWAPTPAFGLRAGFDGLLAVKDFANDENVNVFSLGLVYRFGTGRPADD